MQTLTGKVQKKSYKDNVVYQLRIVHNYRNDYGFPTNKLIKTIILIPENKMKDRLFCIYVWNKIDKDLESLYLGKIMSAADVEKAKIRFAKFLPRPAKPKASATITAGVNLSAYAETLYSSGGK